MTASRRSKRSASAQSSRGGGDGQVFKGIVRRTLEAKAWREHSDARREDVYGEAIPRIARRPVPREGTPERDQLLRDLADLRGQGVASVECGRRLNLSPSQVATLCKRHGILFKAVAGRDD